MRMAKVRYNNSKIEYSFICDLKNVKEGDVVAVEDEITPFFVNEIVDEPLTPGTKYRKVLKKLKENKKVSIVTRYMNIVESDCDCIVNSLGINTNIYGAICKSIVDAAKSDDINNMLKKNPKGKIFDIYVTDAGLLKPKNIIHIVMPYKENDKFNRNLKKAFSLVVDKAIELGMKSIAIPCIGTGANGYDKKDIYDAIDDIMFKYLYTPDIEIEIQSIMFGTTNKQRFIQTVAREKPRGISFGYYEKTKFNFDPNDLLNNMHYVSNIIATYYLPQEELKMTKSAEFYYDTPFSFIDEVIDNSIGKIVGDSYLTKSKIMVDLKQYYHRFNDISDFRTGKKKMTRNDVFKISVAMKLNFTEFIQFMTLAGFTFSPMIGVKEYCADLVVLTYAAENNGFIEGLNDFIEYVNINSNEDVVKILCPSPVNKNVVATV